MIYAKEHSHLLRRDEQPILRPPHERGEGIQGRGAHGGPGDILRPRRGDDEPAVGDGPHREGVVDHQGAGFGDGFEENVEAPTAS